MVDYVLKEPSIDKKKLFILGRSLGAAVAIYTAYHHPEIFRGVIIENAFTSIDDMVDVLFVFARYFKKLILRNHWRSIELVPHLKNPLLFVTGDLDEVIPFEQTLKLYEEAKESKMKRKVRFKKKLNRDIVSD